MNPRALKVISGAALLGAGVLAGLVLSVQFNVPGTGVTVSNEAIAQASTAPLPGMESPFVAVAERA